VKYGICFIIKIFLAALAIVFLVGTVTSIFLYILRMPTHTCNRIIRPSDFSQIEHHHSSGRKATRLNTTVSRNKLALILDETF
jgi:hypothetical protein